MVELLCLDTNKTGCVDVDRPLVVLVVFEVKAINVLGIIMLVLGFCGCLLWSYVVKILCLDKNKT